MYTTFSMYESLEKKRIIDGYDVEVIRPQVQAENIKLRRVDTNGKNRKKIRKALQTLHTLELMAINIYRFQITSEKNELNRHLISAMMNEMTHYQDFQTRILEYGLKPSVHRWMYWLVGMFFGMSSRLLGKNSILKTGIWVETKAIDHYKHLLSKVPWDQDSRKVIEKNLADEKDHVGRWTEMLRS